MESIRAEQLFGVTTLISNAIAAVEIVRSSKATGRKFMWLVIVFIFPLLGLFAYVLLGRKR